MQIGVRRKHGDSAPGENKPNLKLDFNRVEPAQQWPRARGFKKLTLNNGQPDSSGAVLTALASEHLAWRIMRREIPFASRVAYARLSLHFTEDNATVYQGLYILIEDIDRTAIRTRFGQDRGRLLKTTAPACPDRIVFDDGEPNLAASRFNDWWNLDPASKEWALVTEQALQLEDLLRQEAVRDVLANTADTALGTAQNNFLSFDPRSGLRTFLPWDLDDAFRPFPDDVDAHHPIAGRCSELGRRTRCHPDLTLRYLEIVCDLINGTLSAARLLEEWDQVDRIIRPIIPEETALWGGVDPLATGTRYNYQGEHERIRSFIALRIPAVRQQLAERGYSCPAGCVTGATKACSSSGCSGTRRCVSGQWTPCEVSPCSVPIDAGVEDANGREPVVAASSGCGCSSSAPTRGYRFLFLRSVEHGDP